MKTLFKAGDIIVYLFAIILIISSFVGIYWIKSGSSQATVVIEANGKVISSFPLREGIEPEEISIDTGNGKYNIVLVTHQGVRIKEANCPDQVCVRTGTISYPGQSIICIPHKVIIKIIGAQREEPPIDDIAS